MALPIPHIVSDPTVLERTKFMPDGLGLQFLVSEWPTDLPPDPPDIMDSGAADDRYREGDASAVRYILYRIIESNVTNPTLDGLPPSATNEALNTELLHQLFSGMPLNIMSSLSAAERDGQVGHGEQQRDVLSHTETGQWAALFSLSTSTQDGPWSGMASSLVGSPLTEDGPWSLMYSLAVGDGPTEDGPWSNLLTEEITYDGPWSRFVTNSPTEWTPLPDAGDASAPQHSYLRYADVIFSASGSSGSHSIMMPGMAANMPEINANMACYWIMAWLGIDPESILAGYDLTP